MNKVVLITGCSSGFGYCTAKHLSENGYKVYAGVRKEKDLEVFSELPKEHRPATVLLDVIWDQQKINEVIKKIISKEGKIDVLVNNAGFGYLGAVETFGIDEVREQFETNFFGLFKMTKATLSFMRQKRSGLIINLSSISGLFTSPNYGVYSSSKFALEAMSTALRQEENLYNINVVSVNPGSFETKFWENKIIAEDPKSPLNKFNLKVNGLIDKKKSRLLNDPFKVAKIIKKIIETQNPRKNYLVGWDAYIIYFGSRLLPQRVIDWVIKRFVKKLA